MSVVLVTGAGGFVGSAVARRLITEGAQLWDGTRVTQVVALLRPGGSLERLEPIEHEDAWSVESVDLADSPSVERLLARLRPRAVIHTALDAAIYDGAAIGHRQLETLVDAIGKLDDSRLVHTGSAWVLAPGLQLAEDARVDPRSPYAIHKAEEDRLLPDLARNRGVSWINLRLFNVFGRYERPNRLLPGLVARLSRGEPADVSHGGQVRDFNDVDDVSRAFLLALAAPQKAWDAIYHIGSGRGTTARELVRIIAGFTGNADLIRFGAETTPDQELSALVSNPTLAARALGWMVEAPLEDRVRSAVEWWRQRLSSTTGLRPAEESVR